MHYSENLIEACLFDNNQARIARKVGRSQNYISKILKDPEFIDKLETRRQQYIKEIANHLIGGMGLCVQELERIIKDPFTKEQIKINAIQIYLTTASRIADTAIISSQIAEMKEKIDILGQFQTYKGV